MNMQIMKLLAATTLLLSANGQAQEDPGPAIETLELTMELMPEGATQPDAVTRIIELPAVVAEAARENSVRGLAEANAARENQDAGLEIAEEAQERGRDQAQQDREDAGRGPPDGFDPPGRPDDLPGGPPDNGPGPPGN